MIVKSLMVILILSVALISDVTGASYSSVYVGSDIFPVEYTQYGAPYTSIANPRLSQINAVPPVSGYVSPCGAPCVYPTQTVATVTPVVNPNANVLTYKAAVPSVPVVVTPTKEEATGYEYSYVVYDENTGDHKAQRELSDGSVVRGEYSFIQPDGYVREVQYVADDVSGFNAVVKNFLPVAAEGKRKVEVKSKKESSPPCHEVKNESLKEGSGEESGESSERHGSKIHEKLQKKESKKHSKEESESEESKESHEESKEKHHGKSKKESHESGEKEGSHEKHHEKSTLSKEESSEESSEKSKEKHHEKPKNSNEASGEETTMESKEKHHEKTKHSKEESGEELEERHESKPKHSKEESGEESEESEEKHHKKSKPPQSGEGSNEKRHRNNKKESKESGESGEESESDESGDESKEKLIETKEKYKKKSKKGSKESSESEEEPFERLTHGKHKEAHELFKPEHEVQVPYNDVLRCIQAAIKRANEVPSAMREEPSPLTYIVLNKPC